MVLAFAKQKKIVFFKITNEIAPFDRHLDLNRNLLYKRAADGDFFLLFPIG